MAPQPIVRYVLTEGDPRIEVIGELDMTSAPLLIKAVLWAPAAEGAIVLDLRSVSFVDVAGLRSVLDAVDRGAERATIKVLAGPSVMRILEVLEMPLPDGMEPFDGAARIVGDGPGAWSRRAATVARFQQMQVTFRRSVRRHRRLVQETTRILRLAADTRGGRVT